MNCPNRNYFCFVCGLYAPTKNYRNITRSVVTGYEGYFVVAYFPNLWYVPEVVCDYCYRGLVEWKGPNSKHHLKYVQPFIWLPRTEHSPDACYFCLSYPKTFGFKYNIREKIEYADVDSIIFAKIRSEENPTAPSEETFEIESNIDMLSEQSVPTTSSGFVPTTSEFGYKVQHCITQKDFNDLVRDSRMTKEISEVVGSRLKQWNLVANDFKITAGRKRGHTVQFDEHFDLHEDETKQIAYCNNVDELLKEVGQRHISNEWRLFIDSSVKSLKGVLLHNGNKHPSVPIVYSRNTSENYENMKLILELINYNQHKWMICCDLKVVGILTGVKKGFSSYQCFLCVWEGRKRHLHYTNHKWDARVQFKLGQFSIDHIPLVESNKVILPPLHIKLGLIRSFICALDHESEAFKYLKTVFPGLSDAKIKAGVFDGPQTKTLIQNDVFRTLLNPVEKRAWDGFIDVVKNFLGNKKADNYKDIVKEMVSAYGEMKVNMSLKIHFLHNHLDFFPSTLGDLSDEHGERFHKDIVTIENRFKGKDMTHMLAEYCWNLCRDTNPEVYTRKTKRPTFLTQNNS